jgi:hypothetical protein
MDELEVCRLSAEALGYRVSSYPTVGCWLLCNDIILPTPNDRSDVEANSTAYHQVGVVESTHQRQAGRWRDP